jgi:uncharacterized Zn-finger protein
MSNAKATWRKTKSGEWVVYATHEALDHAQSQAEPVTVTTKAGSTKDVAIDSVGKPFTVDGVKMAYGHPRPEPREATAAIRRQPRADMCDNCGGRGARYERFDSSGIPGVVCGRCAREESYELSFC